MTVAMTQDVDEAALSDAPRATSASPATADGPAAMRQGRCARRPRPPARARRSTRYAADYPRGPHDQPQSMCPAFGSLRVGLRMRRTATCCRARPAASTA